MRQGGIHFEQATLQAHETKSANSFSPSFITREELKHELELLRRLIESRK